MSHVSTPDGYGEVLRTQSVHGKTSYLVKGAGFEGWYDALQVVADFADQPDDVIPNENNETTLPYPSRPQGPGWDGTTSTIQPDVDPHLEMGRSSDSLTGESTDEDPVKADVEGLFAPPSRLAGVRPRRVHFAASDDPVLDVSALPEESPTGLENSPINPDGVSTDELFDGDNGFERSASYDRLVIKDDLSFMRYAAENDGEDTEGDDDSDDSSGGEGKSVTAASFALTTTADLHFLANLCSCAEALPLHSKAEHRELQAEAFDKSDVESTPATERAPIDGVTQQKNTRELDEIHERIFDQNQLFHPNSLDLVDHDPKLEKGDSADLYNHYASVSEQGDDSGQQKHRITYDGGMRGIRSGKMVPAVATCSCGARAHAPTRAKARDALNHNKTAAVEKVADGYDKYIGGSDGHYYLIASGGGKLPKGEHYGHYETYQDAHDAVEAIIAKNHSRRRSSVTAGESGVHAPYRIVQRGGRWHVVNALGESKEEKGYATEAEARRHQKALYANVPGASEMAEKKSSKTAAPAQQDAQPTQIESQIEQLMQFWAVDNNGWWHWTGSQADLALLNQMQQQMMAVGVPQGQPGAMQAQSKTAAPALLAALPEVAGAGAAAEGAGAEGAAAGAEGSGALKGMTPGGGGVSGKDVGDMLGGIAQGVQGLFGSNGDAGVAHHGVPFKSYGFVVEANTPLNWREYLQTVASDRLVALAAWADVVQKSKRLRAEGAISVEAFRPDVITAYVQGDNGKYYTTVQRLGSVAPGVGRQLTSTQVSGWSCECEWGQWAWLRKRSFVGRMCSHAYALFNEMRSLDAKARRGKGKPLSAGKFASAMSRTAWCRTAEGGFEWCSEDPTLPTAAIVRRAGGWNAHVWSDGTASDSYHLGTYDHSKYAQRAVARTINAHVRLAESGDIDLVSDGDDDTSPYSDDGTPESLTEQQKEYDEGPGPGIQESKTRTGSFSAFAEHDDGQDDEGPEEDDNGIEEEEDPEDEESLDEEIAEDEGDSDDEDSDDEGSDDDGGHDEPHRRDDDDEGTENPGDESDDDHVEKQSSVAELQRQYGLSHLAGANYSLAEQDRLVREGEGKRARNHGDLTLTGTHYEASKESSSGSPEDVLAFLF